jgi:hypothetical protein
MKVTVEFEVSDETQLVVARNSLERVINLSIRLLDSIENDELNDDVELNLEDWEVCKPIAVSIWDAVRDGCLRAKLHDKKQVRDWTV